MLAASELDDFVERGYVRVRGAFPRALASHCRLLAAEQLAIDLSEPAGWTTPVVRGLVEGQPLRDAANAAPLIEAVAQVLDPDVWSRRPDLGSFVVRFPCAEDPGDTGWHIDVSFQPHDGDRWFVNYRSRGRGLLMLCLLSDVGPADAPPRVLPGTHLEMARLLYPAGEIGLPGAYGEKQSEIPLPDTSGPVEMATGDAGDVYLCHPFLVHAAGWPHPESAPRFIAQPPIGLPGAVRLDRAANELSLVARAIRHGIQR